MDFIYMCTVSLVEQQKCRSQSVAILLFSFVTVQFYQQWTFSIWQIVTLGYPTLCHQRMRINDKGFRNLPTTGSNQRVNNKELMWSCGLEKVRFWGLTTSTCFETTKYIDSWLPIFQNNTTHLEVSNWKTLEGVYSNVLKRFSSKIGQLPLG